ncbi:unnamed protein product [Linum trigynum]|uniref:F-box domain-containing protein n=1 Tax=Linum trigynum TaxID=586398 RepID=A0AAV2E2E5_9ROSI
MDSVQQCQNKINPPKTLSLPAAAAANTSISDLPEPLLHRILTVLPPRHIAQLCTMSKRLYSAWNSIPHLDLDQTAGQNPSSLPKFLYYVYYTLHRRPRGNNKLEKLRLCSTVKDYADYYLYHDAVDYAVADGVEELSLALFCSVLHDLPDSLLGAGSLRVLHLTGFRWEDRDDCGRGLTLSCPLLEKASFFFCDGFGDMKISSCHRLEEVRVVNCRGLKSVSLDNSSCSNLRILDIEFPEEEGVVVVVAKFKEGMVSEKLLFNSGWFSGGELWRWIPK